MKGSTPRYPSPRDVRRGAQQELRKGRPPPPPQGAVRSTLDAASRAMLARRTSDRPPESNGFGSKVSMDGATLVTLFDGVEVPKGLQLTEEEKELRRIQMAVANGNEEESLGCLSGLLGGMQKQIEDGEKKMNAAKVEAEKLQKAMDSQVQDSHRPGRRASRRKRNSPHKDGGAAESEEADEEAGADEQDEEDGEESDDDSSNAEEDGERETADADADGEDKRDRKKLPLPPRVRQGFADLFVPRAEDVGAGAYEEWPPEVQYDELGNASPIAKELLGPTCNRMRRLISTPTAIEQTAAHQQKQAQRALSLAADGVEPTSDPLEALDEDDVYAWPEVGQEEIVGLMRRIKFFRDAELQEDILPVVAEWFELQHWGPFLTIAEEGAWCHSFVILHSGCLEARGRVYRTDGAAAAPSASSSAAAAVAPTLRKASTGEGAAPAAAAKDSSAAADEAAALLPQPQQVGPYEALAPVLLHPGAHFGEAALGGPRFPHTCSVRTLERCTLLVLRRTRLDVELPRLPVTARQGWEEEAMRQHKLFTALSARWKHHNLRRLKFFKGLPPKTLRGVEKIGEYRVVPAGTRLVRAGENMTHLLFILAGQVGVYSIGNHNKRYGGGGRSSAGGGASSMLAQQHDDEGGELERTVSDASDIPLVADGPMMATGRVRRRSNPFLQTASGAPAQIVMDSPNRSRLARAGGQERVVSHTECQIFAVSYAELGRRYGLMAEMRSRVTEARGKPSSLVQLLQQKPAATSPKRGGGGGGGDGGGGKPPGLERGGTHARNIAAGLQAIEAEGGAGRSIGNAHTALTDGSRFANRAHQKITEAIHEQSPPQYRATPGAAAIS